MTNSTRTILGGIVLALLVAAIAVVIPAVPALVWVAVSAMWVAILCMVLATLFVAQGRRTSGPQDFVFPILAWQFLGLHALLSVAVLGLSATGIWSAPWAVFLVGHVILLGVFTLLVLATSAGKDEVDQTGESTRAKVSDWRMLLADLAAAREKVPKDHPDGSVALKAIASLHDALRYSDPMSNPALEPFETALRATVAELVAAVDSTRLAEVPVLADQIQVRLKDRNTRLKALK
jgi:hypothetical protein